MSKEDIEILIIEDEEDLLELIEYHLSKEGYSTTGFFSTDSVEQFIEEESPSLMIVDRNLPGVEGSDFVEYLRDIGYDIPVIFLTAKDREDDLVRGFKSGGDDYMTKPFSHKELLLRVNALLKRTGVDDTKKIKFRDIALDLTTREISIDGEIVNLTQLEFHLLHTFVKSPNIVLDRDYLRDEVWGDSSEKFHDKTINVAINRLKKKIDPEATKNYFLPVWGVGYKLN